MVTDDGTSIEQNRLVTENGQVVHVSCDTLTSCHASCHTSMWLFAQTREDKFGRCLFFGCKAATVTSWGVYLVSEKMIVNIIGTGSRGGEHGSYIYI